MLSNEAVVQSALQLLANSLDPYIEKVLAPHLGPALHWTDILHQLDEIKGKLPKIYSHKDVQPQLRIVTERLGALGYPFSADDPQRLMSIYGNELRLIRNRWAHGDTFSAMEAMRATDTVFIVLTHIGDQEGATAAAKLRSSLIKELVSQPANESPAEDDQTVDAPDVAEKPESAAEQEPEEEPEQAEQRKASPERFRGVRTAFEPWEIVVTGNVETLDSLPKKTAKDSVRATIEEIVDLEGPIHRDRLTKLVGYTYGLGKVHEARTKKIVSQINSSACFTDKEKFVWPADIDPQEWKIYRTSPLGDSRAFTQISTQEIGNAATDILKRKGAIPVQELRRLVLRVFGRVKATRGLTAHFNKAIESAASRGLVSITNGDVCLTESAKPVEDLQEVSV